MHQNAQMHVERRRLLVWEDGRCKCPMLGLVLKGVADVCEMRQLFVLYRAIKTNNSHALSKTTMPLIMSDASRDFLSGSVLFRPHEAD